MKNVEVSVICNVYNQKKYIGKALESFVTQKTNFAFEVLVHDDASTDGTQDIIREYEKRYPDIIKPIYQTENQYSQGIRYGIVYQYPRAQGKYWAMCEGDDYWCDPYKLQKQFDAMEQHPELDICAHASFQDYGGKISDVKVSPSDKDTVFTVEQVIAGGGGFVATASLFARRDVWSQMPEYKRIISLDYVSQIQGSLRGGMLYLKDCMCVYRRNTESSWSVRMRNDPAKYVATIEKIDRMLVALDKETDGKYADVIAQKRVQNMVESIMTQGLYKELLKKEYKTVRKALSFKKKIRVYMGAYLPWLLKLCERIRK